MISGTKQNNVPAIPIITVLVAGVGEKVIQIDVCANKLAVLYLRPKV